MMIVSTGEPIGRWKLWAKWLALVATVFGAAWTIGHTQIGRDYAFGILGFLVIAMYRYRLSEQQVDLIIEDCRVCFTLHMDVLGNIWVEQSSHSTVGKSRIGKLHGASIWLNHEIDLNGRRYNLLIYARKFPSGFIVSNSGRNYQMEVIQNSFCL